MPVLHARGLVKRYGRTQALAGVDVEVGEGELVGLLGPNGAGKSTLVKIACGLVRPTSGTVTVAGAPAGSGKSVVIGRAWSSQILASASIAHSVSCGTP